MTDGIGRGRGSAPDPFRPTSVELPTWDETLAGLARRLQASAEAIAGIAETFLKRPSSHGPGNDGIDLLLGTSDAVANTAHDLLDLATIESDRCVLDDVAFALRPCLQDVLASLARRARSRRLRMELRLSATVPDDLVGDPGRLRQIVRSLVGHALSHAHEGEITLAVDTASSSAAETILVFEIVCRGAEPPGGRGTDASDPRLIARNPEAALGCRVAALMGGSVAVGRRSDDEVVVVFTVPFRRVEAVEVQAPAAARLEGLRVLVTGEPGERFETLCRELRALSLDLVPCRRAEARERFEASSTSGAPFGAVVIGASEDEAHDRDPMLVGGAAATAPIVVVTASGRRGDAGVLRRLGVAGYLTGSPSRLDLADLLRAVLSRADRSGPLVTRHTLRESRAVGRVLVCVGDPLGRCIAARVLEKRGHAVVVLDEPEAAVDALAGDLFDAVVVDAQGDRAAVAHAAAASRARRFEGGAGSALIFLTSGMKRDGRSAQPVPEADAWLELPVDAARLAEIVEVVEPSSSPTPPGGGESERALVDMDAALERAGGDRALVADLADTLIVDARGRVRTMREAVARGDTRAIETEAHAIRSSLGVFGADAMLRVATRLEEAGRVGDLGAASETLAELVSALGRLEPVLREIAAGGRDVSCGGGTTR